MTYMASGQFPAHLPLTKTMLQVLYDIREVDMLVSRVQHVKLMFHILFTQEESQPCKTIMLICATDVNTKRYHFPK